MFRCLRYLSNLSSRNLGLGGLSWQRIHIGGKSYGLLCCKGYWTFCWPRLRRCRKSEEKMKTSYFYSVKLLMKGLGEKEITLELVSIFVSLPIVIPKTLWNQALRVHGQIHFHPSYKSFCRHIWNNNQFWHFSKIPPKPPDGAMRCVLA